MSRMVTSPNVAHVNICDTHTHTHIVLLTYTLTVHIQWRDTRVTAAQSLNQHRALHQD